MIIHNKRYVLLAVLAISSTLQGYGQEKPSGRTEHPLAWREFISEEGRFRVEMPERPKLEILTLETGKSRLVHNTFTVETGAFIWLVDYADLPPKSTTDPVALFNEARNQLLQDTTATLRHQKSLTIEGHPGLEITLHFSGGEARVRFYLVNNRFYQVAVTRLDLLSNSEESMDKFLNSFKIISRTHRTAMIGV